MKKSISIILISIILTSCFGLKTTNLKSGLRVAENPKVYSNKSKFDKSILTNIDTLVIYEEFRDIHWDVEPIKVNIVARKNTIDLYTRFGNYRFYNNGCFSYFTLDRNDDRVLTKNTFDPNHRGLRGVYYSEENKTKGDLIGKVMEGGGMGKIKKEFEFKGDTLIVINKKDKWRNMYLKRKVPVKLLNHNADW